MWSRKPTPVSRVPAPVPSSASVEAHVGLAGLALDLAVRLMALDSPRLRASIDSACTSKPSARAIGAPAAASLRGAARRSAPRSCGGGSGAARAPRRSGRRRPSGSDVVGAGDVVAEGRRAVGADEQAAGGLHAAASALDVGADQLQVLGGERVGERERLARGSATSTSAKAASPTVGRSTISRSSSPASARSTSADGRDGRRRGCPRRARPGRACRAPRGGPRARRTSRAEQRRAGRSGPAKPSMPDDAGELVLGLLHVEVARARRSRRRGRTVSVP